jgi:hypothetical protein
MHKTTSETEARSTHDEDANKDITSQEKAR